MEIIENGTATLRRNIELQGLVVDLETRVHVLTLELAKAQRERKEFQLESQQAEKEANELATQLCRANAENERLERLLEKLETILINRD